MARGDDRLARRSHANRTGRRRQTGSTGIFPAASKNPTRVITLPTSVVRLDNGSHPGIADPAGIDENQPIPAENPRLIDINQ